jgi:DNA mismatch repair protein MLH3
MLQRLNDKLIEHLKSSYEISSVYDCLTQLVYNSIDANATNIQVKINLFTYDLTVTDNGCGIDCNEMKTVGNR